MKLGDKIKFIPSSFTEFNSQVNKGFINNYAVEVVGTVVEIHKEHRWCRVEFEANPDSKLKLYECFKL